MAYSDDAQTPEGGDNPGLLTITMVVVAGLVLIVGCLGIYFFVGRGRPTNAQGITVIEITKIPSATPSLTPIPTLTPVATAQEGTGGGETVPTPDLAATAQAAPASRSVTLSEIRGSVLIKNDIVTDWTMVTTEVSIPQGTTILTNENSTVKIGFIEGTVLRLGPQTQVTLTDMSGTTVDPVTKFKLDFGRAWAVVGDAMGLGRFQIVTPMGAASVVGTFMGVEHNSNGPLDIITCLEGHCRYANASGVQDFFTDQQLESDGPGVPGAPHAMDANQLADWSLTKVPEVITLTPTTTPTATATDTRTPTNTRTPSNTPNEATGIAASTNAAAAATGNAQATYNAGTATALAINQTATQNSIIATATAASSYNSGTSTALAINQTATQNSINLTAAAASSYNSGTSTAIAINQTATQNSINITGTVFYFNATSTAIANAANATNTANAAATQTRAAAATATAAVPVIQFSPLQYSVNESAGTVALTVTMSQPVNSSNVTVDYTLSDLSTTGDVACGGVTDYVNTSGSIIITAGATSRTINVTVCDDGATESSADEQFQAALSLPASPCSLPCSPAPILGPNVTATVTIADSAPPSVAFSNSSYTIAEGNSGTSAATITVDLSRAYANTTTIVLGFTTSDGGASCPGNPATAGSDYVAVTGTLTFSPGEISKTFDVTVNGDVLVESDECLTMTLNTVSGTVSIPTPASELIILNDD